MRRMTERTLSLLAVTTVFLLTVSGTARAQAAFTVTAHSGSLADGAEYLIEVPSDWNGTLFLYSHGYVVPGSANRRGMWEIPSHDFSCSPTTSHWLGLPTPRPDGPFTKRCGTKSPFSTFSNWLSGLRRGPSRGGTRSAESLLRDSSNATRGVLTPRYPCAE